MPTRTPAKKAEPSPSDVEYRGEKLLVPVGMSLNQAMDLLKRRQAYEDNLIDVEETFDVFPPDGACALDRVLERRYGFTPATHTPGFFGPEPPHLISVDVGPDEVRQVPWGRFLLPNVSGSLTTDTDTKSGRRVFALRAHVLRKHEDLIRSLYDDVRRETRENSIYRGKAIKLRFRDDDGSALSLPEPKFLRVEDIDENSLVYSQSVERAIQTNLFVPITRARDCALNGIALKRGVLLGGTYGTGKTLAAAVASKLAVAHGITYVYVPRADELADAIEFAKQYQSPACVVFCEDIDRVTAGERSIEIDDILNTIDGIDSKTANIIVVLTTNALKDINPAMLRPGRLDAVIEVTPPDAKAIEKLIRLYGGNAVAPTTHLSKVCKSLKGAIPAVIAEVVKRAKLAQLAREAEGSTVTMLSEEALLEAAESIAAQVALIRSAEADAPRDGAGEVDAALRSVMRQAMNGDGQALHDIQNRVRKIQQAIAS
jgi:transitional endoplasmic reticulum ATPase